MFSSGLEHRSTQKNQKALCLAIEQGEIDKIKEIMSNGVLDINVG